MYRLEKSSIQIQLPPSKEKEGVNVLYPLQSSFLYLLVGKPGSGKSYLIEQLLLNKEMYFQKYDCVIFISPTTIDNLEMNEKNWNIKFSIEWIYAKIQELNDKKFSKPQMLIIIDDYIDQLHAQRDSPPLLNLLFNRRHLLDRGGIISIIITSQKYKLVPTVFRSCYTGLFIFKLNQEDWKQIKEDNLYGAIKIWDNIIVKLFEEDQNKMRPFLYFNKQTDEIFRNFQKIILN